MHGVIFLISSWGLLLIVSRRGIESVLIIWSCIPPHRCYVLRFSFWTIHLCIVLRGLMEPQSVYISVCSWHQQKNNWSTEKRVKTSHSWSFRGRILLFPGYTHAYLCILLGWLLPLLLCPFSPILTSFHFLKLYHVFNIHSISPPFPCMFLTFVLSLQANAPLFRVPPWLSFVSVFLTVTTLYARMGWKSLKSWVWRSKAFCQNIRAPDLTIRGLIPVGTILCLSRFYREAGVTPLSQQMFHKDSVECLGNSQGLNPNLSLTTWARLFLLCACFIIGCISWKWFPQSLAAQLVWLNMVFLLSCVCSSRMALKP